MKFCEKCGTVLVVKRKEGNKGWYCKKCNKFTPDKKAKSPTIKQKIEQKEEEIKVFTEEDQYEKYPIAEDIECPKCGNNKAYWVLQQTRGGDEPQTKFLCCTKCKYKWREY